METGNSNHQPGSKERRRRLAVISELLTLPLTALGLVLTFAYCIHYLQGGRRTLADFVAAASWATLIVGVVLLAAYFLVARKSPETTTLYDSHGKPLPPLRGVRASHRLANKRIIYAAAFAFLSAIVLFVLVIGQRSYWRFVRDVRSGHLNRISCIALSPDGKYFATSSMDFYCCLWDNLRPNTPLTWQESNGLENGSKVFGVALRCRSDSSASGSLEAVNIYTVTLRGELIRWQKDDGIWTDSRVKAHAGIASHIQYDAAGDVLVTAGEDGWVRLFNPTSLSPDAPLGPGTRLSQHPIVSMHVSSLLSDLDIAVIDRDQVVSVYSPILNTKYRDSKCSLPNRFSPHLSYISSFEGRYHILAIEKRTPEDGTDTAQFLLRYFTLTPLRNRHDKTTSLRLAEISSTWLRKDYIPSCLSLSNGFIYVGYKKKFDFPVPISYKSYLDVFRPDCTPYRSVPLPGYVGAITPSSRPGVIYAAGGVKVFVLDLTDEASSSVVADAVSKPVTALSWLRDRRLVTGSDCGEVWLWNIGRPDRGKKLGDLSGRATSIHTNSSGQVVAIDDSSNVFLFNESDDKNGDWKASSLQLPLRSEGLRITCACLDDSALYVAQNNIVTQIACPLVPLSPARFVGIQVAERVTALACYSVNKVVAGTETGDVHILDFGSPNETNVPVIELGDKIVCIASHSKKHDSIAVVDSMGRLQLYHRSKGRWTHQWGGAYRQGTSFAQFTKAADSIVSIDSGYLVTWRNVKDGRRIERFAMGRDINAIATNKDLHAVLVSFPQWDDTPVLRLYERLTSVAVRRAQFLDDHAY